jgi:pimeloyl-ACP methyl ester carboxylesterase
VNLTRARHAATWALLLAALVAAPALTTPSHAAAPDGRDARDVADRVATDNRATREAERELDAVPVPDVRWERCSPEKYALAGPPAPRAQCALVKVPLDYDRPHGSTTQLAVSRFRAAGESRGVLFFNQGGPGAPAAPFVVNNGGRSISPKVGRHLDVVGIDPRGTGGSERATCAVGNAEPRRDPTFPATRADERVWLQADRTLRRICTRAPSRLVAHVSTADSARDLELVRRALGQPRINFYGLSWGSYLGATYAAMFPSRIRTLMVDGVIDPVAWAGTAGTRNTPYTLRMGAHLSSHDGLVAALDECDRVGPAACPLAPDAHEKWQSVLDAARADPGTAFNKPLTYATIVYYVFGALYNRDYLLPTFSWVARLHAQVLAHSGAGRVRDVPGGEVPQVLLQQADLLERQGPFATRAAGAGAPRSADVLFDATVCSDTLNPQSPSRYAAIAARADAEAPWTGRLWAWSASPCARGGIGSPADAYRGPWDITTSAPILVVGSVHDPATPYRGAQALAGLFPGSRLLTFDGWGHTALGRSDCIARAMGDYLVDRVLPAPGATCEPELGLFDPPAG